MRRNHKNQSGFTLIEAMIGMFILVTVFAFSFKNLAGIRKNTQAVNTTGPHVFFESFAMSRLSLFFAKLMQWNTHVCRAGSSLGEGLARRNLTLDCLCQNTGFFAYAANNTNLGDDRGNQLVANLSLGADMRMALSTFTAEELSPTRGQVFSLTDLAVNRRGNPNALPWGALIPFEEVAQWDRANPAARRFCVGRAGATGTGQQGTANEMCDWFAQCTQEAGRLRPRNQIRSGGFNTETVFVRDQGMLMCFVFAGNLFTHADSPRNQSTGASALEFPSVVGLAVARATLVNNADSRRLTCRQSVSEINRSMKVEVTLYTAMHSDQANENKHVAQKSIREITGEKIGIPIPNCDAPGRGGFTARADANFCIDDPTWYYDCNRTCDVNRAMR